MQLSIFISIISMCCKNPRTLVVRVVAMVLKLREQAVHSQNSWVGKTYSKNTAFLPLDSIILPSGRPNIRIRIRIRPNPVDSVKIRIRPNPPKIWTESESYKGLKKSLFLFENFMRIIFFLSFFVTIKACNTLKPCNPLIL